MAAPQIPSGGSPLSLPDRPRSQRSSSSGSNRSGLSLDLSDLPPLITPAPPSNTLLITNLNDPQIFHPENLHNFRTLLSQSTPLHSFSPLKSLRRIIVVFPDSTSATTIKSSLDGTAIHGDRIRVYFGEPTPLMTAEEEEQRRHLQAPKVDKLFFISPPPSPPAGWEVRNEEPPNKDVHAEDLAAALAKLHARPVSPTSPELGAEQYHAAFPSTGAAAQGQSGSWAPYSAGGMEGIERGDARRSRSATIVYHPGEHGCVADLPAIAVEDTSEGEEEGSPMEGVEKRFVRTERPPVEVGFA